MLKEKLNKAMELWINITGVKPNQNSFHYYFNSKFSDYDVKQSYDIIKECLEYDKEDILAFSIIEQYLNLFLENSNVSFKDLLNNKKRLNEQIRNINKLQNIFKDEEVVDYKNEIFENCKKAISFYNPNIDISKFEYSKFVKIRLNALMSEKYLIVDKFLEGKSTLNNIKYNKDIYCFKNINTLLSGVFKEECFNGISLCVVLDENELSSSYFAFVIRNGENLYLLSDRPLYKSPIQKYLTRTKGKDFQSRIDKNYFPYDLLDISINKYNINIDNKDKLNDKDYYIISSISDLSLEEIAWISNMFSIINTNFFKQQPICDISYTSGMINNVNLLSNSVSIDTYNKYKKLDIKPVTLDNIEDEQYNKFWENKNNLSKANQWMFDRYKDQVDLSTINYIEDIDTTKKYLKDNNMKIVEIFNDHNYEIKPLENNIIGSKEDILRSQIYVARYNLAIQLNKLANTEFKEKRSETFDWFETHLKNNQEFLLECFAKGECIAPVYYDTNSFYKVKNKKDENIFKVSQYDRNNIFRGVNLSNIDNYNYKCFLTSSNTAIVGTFKVDNPETIALLCGCTIEELPFGLQVWNPYSDLCYGNPNLDCLDPMEWKTQNPWSDLDLNVNIFLSKKAYNNLRKKYKLPLNRIWEK